MRTATIIFKYTIDEQRHVDQCNEMCADNDQSTVETTDFDGYLGDIVRDMMSGYSNTQFIDGEAGTKLKEDAEEIFHISTEWVD